LGKTNSDSENDDPIAGGKVTSKGAQMCVEKFRKYIELNSVRKGVIQNTDALGIVIGKINEKKKFQTNISVYLCHI
jgi:hypothetical protein